MRVLVSFILVVGIVITVLIVLALSKSKDKGLPQQILSVFFLFLLFVSIHFYADLHELGWLYAISYMANDITTIVVGPLLLSYVTSLFISEQQLVKKMKFHFIPHVVYLIFVTLPIMAYDFLNVILFSYLENDHFIDILYTCEDVYLVVYLLYTLHVLKQYKSAIAEKYPRFSTQDFKWIKVVLVGAILVISIDIVLKIIYDLIGVTTQWDVQYIVVIAMIFLVLYLGYHGVHQSKVLLPDLEALQQQPNTKTPAKESKLSKPLLPVAEFESLQHTLETVLSTDRPYLDEELTLSKLAEQIGTTSKKLSTLLNQYMDTTFYDLINTYRINAIKEKLHSEAYQQYTLLGISYECGFKSKTSFNRIFKKETGLSPSAYRKKISKVS